MVQPPLRGFEVVSLEIGFHPFKPPEAAIVPFHFFIFTLLLWIDKRTGKPHNGLVTVT